MGAHDFVAKRAKGAEGAEVKKEITPINTDKHTDNDDDDVLLALKLECPTVLKFLFQSKDNHFA